MGSPAPAAARASHAIRVRSAGAASCGSIAASPSPRPGAEPATAAGRARTVGPAAAAGRPSWSLGRPGVLSRRAPSAGLGSTGPFRASGAAAGPGLGCAQCPRRACANRPG